MDSIIKLEDITVNEWEKGKIEFEVTDENNNPVNGRVAVKINHKTHINSVIENGKFSKVIDFSNLHSPEYRLDVIYGGNDECAPATETAKLFIKKAEPIFISVKDLQNACYRLTKWIEAKKRVPGKILINKQEVSIGNLYYLLVRAINNLNNNNKDDLELQWVQSPSVSSETINESKLLSKEEYLKITEQIDAELNDLKVCNSHVEVDDEKIGFMNLIYILSTIITNSSLENGLISGVYIKPCKEL